MLTQVGVTSVILDEIRLAQSFIVGSILSNLLMVRCFHPTLSNPKTYKPSSVGSRWVFRRRRHCKIRKQFQHHSSRNGGGPPLRICHPICYLQNVVHHLDFSIYRAGEIHPNRLTRVSNYTTSSLRHLWAIQISHPRMALGRWGRSRRWRCRPLRWLLPANKSCCRCHILGIRHSPGNHLLHTIPHPQHRRLSWKFSPYADHHWLNFTPRHHQWTALLQNIFDCI